MSDENPNPSQSTSGTDPKVVALVSYLTIIGWIVALILNSNNKSDPFLKLRLGKTTINDKDRYLKETVNPDFYRVFELPAELPGASQLDIELWDYDKLSANDFIGKTVIDLEDRWFEQAWQNFGLETETSKRFRRKPVEIRGFWNRRVSKSAPSVV